MGNKKFTKDNIYLKKHPDAGNRTYILGIRFTPKERETLECAAAKEGLSASELVRKVIWDESKRWGIEVRA